MDTIYDLVGHQVSFNFNGKKIEIDLRQAIWPISTFSVFYMLFLRKTGFNNRSLKALEPQNDEDEHETGATYEPKEVDIPPIKGWLVSLMRKISRSPFGRSVLTNQSKRKAELDMFLQMRLTDSPTFFPVVIPDEEFAKIAEENQVELEQLIKPSGDAKFHFNTISDYNIAYRNKTATPLEIARRVINAIKDSEKPTAHKPNMRIIIEYHEDEILKLASESTERWKREEPLSVFDGIPVAVKDEIFLGGYLCYQGLPHTVKDGVHDIRKTLTDEGWMVGKLRQGGAVFIGMSNMHQLGIGVTGINQSPNHGTSRNPVNPQFPTGGSSSGSAAAVGAGLCPIALGADGGGSIRLPAAICGVVGAKASFARISCSGLCYGTDTLGHAGALCSTVRDSAITYGFLAGKDTKDINSLIQPNPTLIDFEKTDLAGITVGIDWDFFNHCEPEIAEACRKGVDYLSEKCGAKIVDISIAELNETQRAHIICILTEMYTYHKELYHKYHDNLNAETELNLGIGSTFTGEEYYKIQSQRTRAMMIFKKLFKSVDSIVTPAFGDFVPKLDNAILEYGVADIKNTSAILRFAVHANITGIPGITVPVDYSKQNGLPIAIQIMTPWWREDLMFRIAHAMEGALALRKPQVYYDLMSTRDVTSDDDSEN